LSKQQEAAPPAAVKTGFESFMQQYNEGYIMRCKELGLQEEYELEVDGKITIFKRKRLTARVFNELEKARAEVEKKNRESDDGIANAERQAELYFHIAQAYLTNKDTGQPISKDDYLNIIWEDTKLVLDACHLRTMMGTPF
jgi:hypothetical protein